MRIHLIKKQTIEDFVENNTKSRIPFNNWLNVIKYANWNKPSNIKNTFGSADLLGKGTNRVVFDIGGNNFRIICKYAFGKKEIHLFVCWIGTHEEYEEICDKNKQYTVNDY